MVKRNYTNRRTHFSDRREYNHVVVQLIAYNDLENHNVSIYSCVHSALVQMIDFLGMLLFNAVFL